MAALPVVTLYGRPGCSLCDQTLADLRRLAPRLRFEIESVNIEQDDALLARFLIEIPVVAVGGEVLLKAPIWPAALEDTLAAALQR